MATSAKLDDEECSPRSWRLSGAPAAAASSTRRRAARAPAGGLAGAVQGKRRGDRLAAATTPSRTIRRDDVAPGARSTTSPRLFSPRFKTGLDGTGVRPGIIGEIGASQGWVSPLEERVHRAAARAQRATGLPLATHTLYHSAGQQQMRIFDEEGVDPARVCIGHCDTFPTSPTASSSPAGAATSLSTTSATSSGHEERVRRSLLALVERGYARARAALPGRGPDARAAQPRAGGATPTSPRRFLPSCSRPAWTRPPYI